MNEQEIFCPYCGSKMLFMASDEREPGVSVKCGNCKATGPKASGNSDAVRLFRRRVGMSRGFMDAMQEVIRLDPVAFEDLLKFETPCDEAMLKDRWTQVVKSNDNEFSIRLLGFINGVLGRMTGGIGVSVHKDEARGLCVRIVDLGGLRDGGGCGIS